MIEAEQIMKRCQVGTRNYNEANNLHAACYALIGKLLAQRTWQGLTDEEIKTICSENGWDSSWQSLRFAQAIEAKLKEKNCAG